MSLPLLRAAALLSVGVFRMNVTDDETTLSGSDAELLKCIAEKMRFERYEVRLAPDGHWGQKLKNGTWTGMIGMLVRGEADIAVMWVGMTEERFQVVDFSVPYLDIERVFVVGAPGFLPKFEAFTYPFSSEVWVLCLVMVLTFALYHQRSSLVKFLSTFLALAGSLLTQAFGIKDGRDPVKRLVWTVWSIFSGIVPFLYSVSLLSYLTVPQRSGGLETFQDLSDAVGHKTHRCFMGFGSAEGYLLLSSSVEYLRTLGQNILDNDWTFDNRGDFRWLIDQTTAVIAPRKFLELIIPRDTNTVVSKDSFGVGTIAVAVRKGFCCKEQLDSVIYGINGGGLMNKWFGDEVFRRNSINVSTAEDSENVEHSLNLKDLENIFGILAFGYALGFVVLFIELIYEPFLKVRFEKCVTLFRIKTTLKRRLF